MSKDSRIEDKKRYNAPYLRAFDYLAKEMRVTQGRLVEMMNGNSSFISAYRSGTKRVGLEYMKRLCEVFSIYFKGERHLNMRYLEGTSQYMLVENIPDEEIHEIMQRDGDPDYDVVKQRNQKEIQSISYSYKDGLELELVLKSFLKLLDFFAQTLYLLYSVNYVLPVKISELDLSNIFGLSDRKVEPGGKVRNNVLLLLGISDDPYRLINIKKNGSKTKQELELVLFFSEIVIKLTRVTLDSEFDPFLEYLLYAKLHRRSLYKDIEVTVEVVLKLGYREELLHYKLGIGILTKSENELKAVEVDSISDVDDLSELSGDDHILRLLHNRLNA